MAAAVARYPMAAGSARSTGLAAVVVLEMGLLVALQATDTHGPLELIGQAALAITFTVLAIVDFRLALAVAVLELVVGGASGRWTSLPGGVSGRILLDGILGVVAVARLATRPAGSRWNLGRYGWHALALAVIAPAIWMPLGVLSGNPLNDVIADGDGFFFFAFAIVLAAAALDGGLGWLRRWLLIACLINALLLLAAFGAISLDFVSVEEMNRVLLGPLHMGGFVGTQAPGVVRLYLASGLYLQLGVVIVAWELVRDWRRLWPWLALLSLVAALLVTYTRGYWLGAFVGAAVVVALHYAPVRWRLAVVGGLAAVVLVAGFGFALVDAGGGPLSNFVKLQQASVLIAHVVERPLLGWGFGSVAPDYPFSTNFSYEITYLDRAFKMGVLGLTLFLSFPIRLLGDGWRVLVGRLPPPPHMRAAEAVVPLGILASVLLASATNPYMAGSVGIGAIVLCIAWLDPFEGPALGADS